MPKKTSNNQAGVALLFTIILLSIMLSISLALAAIFLPKIRISADTKNSVGAFFAADSATELCLYEARKQIVPNPTLTLISPAYYTIASPSSTGADVTIISTNPANPISGDCRFFGTGAFRFRARGELRTVNRAIEASQ